MNILIVDDEKNAIDNLIIKIGRVSSTHHNIYDAQSIAQAVAVLDQTDIDIIFLDIELQKEKGFDLLKIIDMKSIILIFVTAFDKYAITAFRYYALTYLLKPVDDEDLKEAFQKIESPTFKKGTNYSSHSLTSMLEVRSISVHISEGTLYIKSNDIIYLEGQGSYTRVHTVTDAKPLSTRRLSYYETVLSEYCFIRIHKSYIINLLELKLHARGNIVQLSNGARIPIGRKYKNSFLEALEKISIR